MLIFLQYIILTLITIVPVILAVAFYTVAERRIMARMQKRQGPNVVGIQGILQPFADALKLIIKESAIPQKAHSSLFILAPCLTLFLSLLSWAVIPISGNTDFSFIS